MSFQVSFKPWMELLEAREVPAAFSVALSNGVVMSGQFSAPDGVDAGVGSQSLDVSDLAVQVGTATFESGSFTSTPTAHYSYGQLDGVTFTVDDPSAAGYSLVTVGGNQGAVTPTGGSTGYGTAVFDTADTMVAFTLPDGTVGAIAYTIPWDDVDAASADQSVSPTSFRLNIAGQNFDYPAANFTTAPTLHFAYGEFTGVTFGLDTSGVSGFAYSAFSATLDPIAGNTVTATKVGVGQLQPSLIVAKQAQVVLYFNTGANDTKDTVLPTGTRIRIHIESAAGANYDYDYDATTVAGETVGNVSQQVYENLKAAHWNVMRSDDGRSIIVNGFMEAIGTPEQGRALKKVTKAGINYSTVAQPITKAQDVQLLIFENNEWKPKPNP
jgi:hypothetical protein